jgi:hypothetical protein
MVGGMSRHHFTAQFCWYRPSSAQCVLIPRSYQCPPDSGRSHQTLPESGGVQRIKNWQIGLPIFQFRQFLSPAELDHSGIDTGMLPRIHQNGMQLESGYRSGN